MKKLIIILFMLSTSAHALDQCFVYKRADKIISSGQCEKRYPPQSTFKIAIGLMGFEDGILIDEHHPVEPFKKGYPDSLESWKAPQDPSSWITNSCVWYSQVVTKKLGIEKFKKYLKQFSYGNQDVSGTKAKPDALTTGWITSSIKISPVEQVEFLEKFLNSKLNLKKEAENHTRQILFLQDLDNGWKFYGKTGAGDLLNVNGTNDKTHERGWFVGWVEKDKQRITFAQYLELKNIKNKKNNFSYIASKKAKEMVLEKIRPLIADMSKTQN